MVRLSIAAPWQAPRLRWLAGLILTLLGVIGLGTWSPSPALADGPTTFSNTTAISIPATGSVNQIGNANPYPSTISVSGMNGLVSDVRITLTGFQHGIVGDVDLLLVAPGGANLMVMSDIGNQIINGGSGFVFTSAPATLTIADGAAAFPARGVLAAGTYRPTDIDEGGATDTFGAPAPTPSANTSFAGAFAGIGADGTWSLYAVDDATGDVGGISGGWSITITTEVASVATTTSVASSNSPSQTGGSVTFTATVRAGGSAVTAGSVSFTVDGAPLGSAVALDGSGTASLTTAALTEGTHLIRATYGGATGFLTSQGTVSQIVDNPTTVTGTNYCNTGVIQIASVGVASVYPSRVTVSGLSGSISAVKVRLLGLGHSNPEDIDVLLVGPGVGHDLILLSDAGGATPVSGVNLTFDDTATASVGTPMATGTYRPTNIASPDPFAAPAPTPSGQTTLAGAFGGAAANGTWSLFIMDDATADAGSLAGGWCVDLTMTVPTTTTLSGPTSAAPDEPITVTATVAHAGGAVGVGSVDFALDGGTAVSVPVGGDGTASWTVPAQPAGSHSISAAFGGSPPYVASTASPLTVEVVKVATSIVLSGPTSISAGDDATVTATVTAGGSGVGLGTVDYTVDGGSVQSVPVAADGTATLTIVGPVVGDHTITASYTDASGVYATSTATPITFTVSAPPSPSPSASPSPSPSPSASPSPSPSPSPSASPSPSPSPSASPSPSPSPSASPSPSPSPSASPSPSPSASPSPSPSPSASPDPSPSPSAPGAVRSVALEPVSVSIARRGRYITRVTWRAPATTGGPVAGDRTYEVATRDRGQTGWTIRYVGSARRADVSTPQGLAWVRVTAITDGSRGPSVIARANRHVVNIVSLHPKGRTWRLRDDDRSVGRNVLVGARRGSRATFTLPAATSYALVARTHATGGRIEIRVDGRRVATVDLRSRSPLRRQVVWRYDLATRDVRRIEIRLLRGRADLDAFIVTR